MPSEPGGGIAPTASSPEEAARAKEAVQSIVDLYTYIAQKQDSHGFDEAIMRDLRLIEAHGHPGDPLSSPPVPPSPNPSTVFEFEVTPGYTNLNGVMHGGAITTLFDMTTMLSLGPIQRQGYWEFQGGLTRTLSTSCLKGIPTGATIRIRSWVVQHGRTMALMRCQLESMDGKTIYATGEQHKVNVPSVPEHISMKQLMMDMKQAKSSETAKL